MRPIEEPPPTAIQAGLLTAAGWIPLAGPPYHYKHPRTGHTHSWLVALLMTKNPDPGDFLPPKPHPPKKRVGKHPGGRPKELAGYHSPRARKEMRAALHS